MSEAETKPVADAKSGGFGLFGQRKIWWFLPLVIFVLLLVIIYVLVHLSAADSEMYPTTRLMHFIRVLSC